MKYLVFILPLLGFIPAPEATELSCTVLFEDATRMEQSGNFIDAYYTFYDVCNSVDCKQDVILIDKAYQRAAKLAQSLVNPAVYSDPCQRYSAGIMSVDTWLDYISWYTSLTTEQVGSLPLANVQNAVVKMGETIASRGLRPVGCDEEDLNYAELFALYKDIDPNHFNARSMNLWIHWLLRCKENGAGWRTQPKAFNLCVAPTIALENSNEWNDFAMKLEAWLETPTAKRLTPIELNGFRTKLAAVKLRL